MRLLTSMLAALAFMSFAGAASAMCNGMEHKVPADQTAEVPPILIPPQADT